jgi:hypothetical protein
MNAKSLAIGLALETVVGPNLLEGAKKALGREILARSGQGRMPKRVCQHRLHQILWRDPIREACQLLPRRRLIPKPARNLHPLHDTVA